uniref:Calpain-D n=1 Tax=Lygus hesperus TaxID=30085 RepID=A0A0A9X332_LYGHE
MAFNAKLTRINPDGSLATSLSAAMQREMAENREQIEREMCAVKALLADNNTQTSGKESLAACELLQQCVAHNTPYVDLSFAPQPAMICVAGRDIRELLPAVKFMRPGWLAAAAADALSHNKSTTNKEKNEKDEMKSNYTLLGKLFAGPIIPQAVSLPYALGNTWLISALAILAEKETLLRHLFHACVPDEMECGGYRVCLNLCGKW